ncbi:MAG: sigma-54-dependent Fis family transcriptional regulator [Chlamydiae bacterium]|nr:sigma-54-dependent Fis family transcriptional regulator [Chlamydiota bacterium]MBI3276529.1 sigma-54-dependent Fis family transcriptional regulator [Chlamydiota bacterium]
MIPKILIVDDEINTREGLARALGPVGYEVYLAANGEEALKILRETSMDLMLTDLRMSGMGGLQLLDEAHQLDANLKIIVFTAYGSIETAVQAMRRGAYDYLSKPVNLDALEIILSRTLQAKRMESENQLLREQLNKKFGFENIIGESQKMKEIYELIQQVAPTKATVLIQGESGTGKELIAHALHHLSPRKDKPLVALHCAALSESLLESELFGHEKGAFTGALERHIGRFEKADGGTIFLDEISEVSPRIQVKLLRVLQEMAFERVGGNQTLHVDVRAISATNTHLKTKVKEGSFREDLYYRLHVVFIQVPPLRERKEDVPLLVQNFLKQASAENNKIIHSISPKAMEALTDYEWPGNVRELKNAIQSMVVLAKKPELGASDLPPAIREMTKSQTSFLNPGVPIREAEKNLILQTLNSTNFNKTKAAQLLGISRRTLHRKILEYSGPQKLDNNDALN